MKQIPNLFTLGNLFFGCLAIVYAMDSALTPMFDSLGRPIVDPNGNQFINIPQKIWMASIFIFIAALIDFLDGFVARLLKASSEMGRQLDSLADVVSFGVAPAIIIYHFLKLSYAQQEDGLSTSMAWLLPAFIIPCAGAYRLARYNIDPSQNTVFKGLPIPAAGLLIASFPLIYWYSDTAWMIRLLTNHWFWYAVIFLLSWLMVSRLPMMSMKFANRSARANTPLIILLVTGIVAAIFLRWAAIPLVLIVYILLSLLLKNKPHDVYGTDKSNAAQGAA